MWKYSRLIVELNQLIVESTVVKMVRWFHWPVITFKNYKHNYNQNPFSIILAKQLNTCPVKSFLDYFLLRGPSSGPHFINQEGLPVLRSDFCKMFCSVVHPCNLDPKKYKGHSFRIGAATYAAEQGFFRHTN